MAIRRLDRSFAPTNKEINYLVKTMPQFKQSLIDFARVYFKDTYTDFNEASPGMMFIEMSAMLGDVLSFYIDNQYKENLLQYADDEANVISIAQSFGFKAKPATAANTLIDFYQLIPATSVVTNYIPDSRYYLLLDVNAVTTSNNFSAVKFRTIDVLDFSDPTNRTITVYSTDNFNNPLMYLVKKSVNVVAGEIKTYTVNFGSPTPFSTITLPDPNVLEIISVTDSNGFTWSEVDYLAQDLIFVANVNTSPNATNSQSVPPTYNLSITRTPRRFVSRYDENFNLTLEFGSGLLGDSDQLISLSPSQIASSEYGNNLASTSLDPSDFLSSQTYGLAPANVQLTIEYTTGGGLASNVPSNSLVKLTQYNILNDRGFFTNPNELALFDDVTTSLAVNNSSPAVGGKDKDSVEEIRLNALGFFNAQNRLVTAQDYTVRAYAMPAKFGGVAKAFVAQDEQINNVLRETNAQAPLGGQFVNDNVGFSVVNLYVLGYDQNEILVPLNDQTKQNLKSYLDQYRILTDEIRIMDAFVITIGVNFNIVVFQNYNMNEVLARCIDSVSQFFDITKWQINQPIVLSDLYIEIAKNDGVQSVTNLEIVNKYSFKDGNGYSPYIYDIADATVNGIVLPSIDPSIFQITFPSNDVVGSAQQ